jgi:hypothetical protein
LLRRWHRLHARHSGPSRADLDGAYTVGHRISIGEALAKACLLPDSPKIGRREPGIGAQEGLRVTRVCACLPLRQSLRVDGAGHPIAQH